MSNRTASKRIPAALVVAAFSAALAAVSSMLVTRHVAPAPELFGRDFAVERPNDEPVVVTPDRCLTIPYPFGDFDLTADVTVPAGGALDLVLRKVEPKRTASGDMPLFHGRFTSLRLSARGHSGPALRTREQALLEPGFDAGQDVAADLPATILVEARGRHLRANVAGVWHGPFDATDAHGDLAFVATGGPANVGGLRIVDRPRPRTLLPIGWSALAGALLGLVLAARGGGRVARPIGAAIALPAVAFLAGGLVAAHELPQTEPETASLVLLALSGAPLALGLAGRFRPVLALVGAVAAVGAWELAARIETPRLRPLEDVRLDALFGADSGSAPFDALAQRLHARAAVHTVGGDAERVVFLGGGPLYEGGADFNGWIGTLAAARAGQTLGRRLDGVVVPTLYSNAGQQVRLFDRCYADAFAPRAVVLAIPPWEGEASERPGAGYLGDAEPLSVAPAPIGPLVLATLWSRASAAAEPTTDPAGLRRTLAQLAATAGRIGAAVCVVDDPAGLGALREVVVAECEARGWTRLSLSLDDVEDATARLADALTGLLRAQ